MIIWRNLAWYVATWDKLKFHTKLNFEDKFKSHKQTYDGIFVSKFFVYHWQVCKISTSNFLFDATTFHSLATCFGHFRLSLASWSLKLQNVQTWSTTLPSDPTFSLYHIVIECGVAYLKILSFSNYMIRQTWDPSIALLHCIFLYLVIFRTWTCPKSTGKVRKISKLFIYKPAYAQLTYVTLQFLVYYYMFRWKSLHQYLTF